MERHDCPRWAPRVSHRLIRELYEKNAAGIYDEDTFMKTRMAQTPEGNFGKRCVERITFELEELE